MGGCCLPVTSVPSRRTMTPQNHRLSPFRRLASSVERFHSEISTGLEWKSLTKSSMRTGVGPKMDGARGGLARVASFADEWRTRTEAKWPSCGGARWPTPHFPVSPFFRSQIPQHNGDCEHRALSRVLRPALSSLLSRRVRWLPGRDRTQQWLHVCAVPGDLSLEVLDALQL